MGMRGIVYFTSVGMVAVQSTENCNCGKYGKITSAAIWFDKTEKNNCW